MFPSGSWYAATASTVSARARASRIPGTGVSVLACRRMRSGDLRSALGSCTTRSLPARRETRLTVVRSRVAGPLGPHFRPRHGVIAHFLAVEHEALAEHGGE